MAKGVSIKFQSYSDTVPRLLQVINFSGELKKHSKIILKPFLRAKEGETSRSTSVEFVEAVLKFCLQNKNPVAEVFIAEGADGQDTTELFKEFGYDKLAEKYSVGLVDLNKTEVEKVEFANFLKFEEIMYPKILKEGFVVSLPKLSADSETAILASLSNMLGAFPSSHYKGFFSKNKNKIRKWPLKYSVHDILQCKMPEFAVIDASDKGAILAGIPEDIDRQAAKLLGFEWKNVGYLRLTSERIPPRVPAKKEDSLSSLGLEEKK